MTLTPTIEASIQQFATCFTKPSFQTFCVIVTGWLLGHGRRVVTRVLPGDNTVGPLLRPNEGRRASCGLAQLVLVPYSLRATIL